MATSTKISPAPTYAPLDIDGSINAIWLQWFVDAAAAINSGDTFGPYIAGAPAATGYITITDSNGNTHKLLCA